MSSSYSDDDQRMIRLQEGDPAAFSEIVGLWQGPLFCFFLRNTRDEHLSEDLVQETLPRRRCLVETMLQDFSDGDLEQLIALLTTWEQSLSQAASPDPS